MEESISSDIESRVARLEYELESVRARNSRVESDKAWEMSPLRIGAIATITYVIVFVVLYLIGAANPALSALVPAIGYLLSTQTMPRLKRYWIDGYDRH